MGEVEEIPLIFKLSSILALLSNYDRENCLIIIGTEGQPEMAWRVIIPHGAIGRFCPSSFPLRIPMMSISRSDLMPISAERSDAGLSQCETVIDISQEFSRFLAPPFGFHSFLRPDVFGR